MADSPDALSVALRAVSFVLLLNAAGIVIFITAFGRYLVGGSLQVSRRLGWQLAAGALFFVAAHHFMEAARMAGEMSGMWDPDMQMTALKSPQGRAFALRMLGSALIVVGLWRAPGGTASPHAGVGRGPRGGIGPGAAQRAGVGPDAGTNPGATQRAGVGPLIGAALCLAAFATTGHTSVAPHHMALTALLLLHLLVVAFWIGALWPLYIATNRETPQAAARLIDAFSRAASWLVPGILLAGVGLTALLVPSLAVFKQPYGQLLLAKIALFAVLMGLAAFNKWIFGPAIADGDTRVAKSFRITVLTEYLLISTVLAITAALTTFYSPEAP